MGIAGSYARPRNRWALRWLLRRRLLGAARPMTGWASLTASELTAAQLGLQEPAGTPSGIDFAVSHGNATPAQLPGLDYVTGMARTPDGGGVLKIPSASWAAVNTVGSLKRE